MGSRYTLLRFLSALSVSALFTLAAFAVDSSYQAFPLQLKVLSADYYPINGGTTVPKDCDLQNYSAYCNESRTPTGKNVLVVQDAEGRTITLSCVVDSQWSNCASLPEGSTFQARQELEGVLIVFRNAKGKEKRQLYQVVSVVPAAASSATPMKAESNVAAPPVSAPRAAEPAPVPVTAPAVPAGPKVKCTFTSTPPGAEITIDNRYMGNTPSEIGVPVGTHVVEFAMPGFAPWKRELTVAPDSVLTVTAHLQKAP